MNPWRRTFICMFVAQVFSILGFSFALPFLPFFIRDLGITDPSRQAWWAGLILAAHGVTLALFAPIWGILADRFGRKSMVIRSMVGGFLVLMLMSHVRTVGQLLVCRFIQGSLTGTVSASIALVASVTPRRRSGFALGMMQSAVLVGMAIGPLLGGLVADAFGYRAAFRVGAFVVLLGGLIVYFGAHEEFSPPDAEQRVPRGFNPLKAGVGFGIAVLILFSVRFSNTLVSPSFPLIIQDLATLPHRLNATTGGIIAAAGAAGAASAAALGFAGDRIGHRRIVIGCCLGAAVFSFAHSFARNIGELTVAHLFFGMAVAGTMPAANAMIQHVTDPVHMGKAFGAASALGMAGLALGPLAGGLLGRHLGIRVPFLFAGFCQILVVLLAATLARRMDSGPSRGV